MDFNKDKFANLVHYICHRSDQSSLGAVKLNKILWYADTKSYVMTGRSITGANYIKRQFGPVPERVVAAITELEANKSLAVREVEHYSLNKREFISLRRPNVSAFSPEEIFLVDELIDSICKNYSAKSISEQSHDRIWELADIGESIPYHAVLATELGEITEEDITWANAEVKKLGRANAH